MRRLSDAQRTDLAAAVERLAWTAVRETLQLGPDAGPGSDLADADLREMWLAALTSLLAIRDSAEQLAASAALSAAQRGADYPAIGEAAGMTRQGARRKWPGLAGLSDERQRKLAWWASRGDQFARCARAVLATSPKGRAWPSCVNGSTTSSRHHRHSESTRSTWRWWTRRRWPRALPRRPILPRRTRTGCSPP